MLSHETAPFILLDDARGGGAAARLYTRPVRTLRADTPGEVLALLDEVRAGQREGLSAAGYLAYEAAAAFEPVLGTPPDRNGPLAWFGLFAGWREFASADVPALLPDPAGAWIGTPRPRIERAAYDAALAQILELIAAGDLYQANLTYRAAVPIAGHPLAAYARLRERSRAGFGAVVWDGARWTLSLSPELFFALKRDTLTCRPMKGTARRGSTVAEDDALTTALRDDPKQRAENLMIVDLMRNDLSRVAVPGSVAVPELFAVERYPTVLQMTSTVTATLARDRDAIDVLAALFPCGSVTGAPKLRAIAALGEIEGDPRGSYTGAIGRIDAGGDGMFNVTIRTLTIDAGADEGGFGVGGGIVADSRAADEWDETLAKSAFLTDQVHRFDLIETMAFDPVVGVKLLDRHLARMKASADRFGFAFDRHNTRNELQAATFRLRAPSRVRLVLAASGAIAVETSPIPAPAAPLSVAIMPLPVDAQDFRLRHKSSDRRFYDDARAVSGCDEVLFTDPQGRLTEGSFTSIFVKRDGTLLTPPLARGLLPGVLRAELIANGQAVEHDLGPTDLAGGFLLGNALRGLVPAIVAVADLTRAGL